MLPLSIRSKRFEAIARRNAKITQYPRLIQKTKLPQSDVLDVRRQFSARRPDQINSVSESAKPWIMK
jgi:hypothetical protein